MRKSKNKEKREFISRFFKSSAIVAFEDNVSTLAGLRVSCLFFDSEARPLENYKKKDLHHIVPFLKNAKSRIDSKIRIFNCTCKIPCMFIPVRQGSRVYGFIIVPHLKIAFDKREFLLLKSYIDIALREFQKEQELSKLYDTIRPRAIALSTIHTIHRLLSSTLDMDELIERIARLTLQVMRARYCAIMLLDESKNYLIPKAVIDLKKNTGKVHKNYKKIRVGIGVIGKVTKSGKTCLSRDLLCVPLVEEDIIGVICAKYKIDKANFNKFDEEILYTLAEQAVIAIKNAQLYEELEKTVYGSIRSLGALLDSKSPNTFTHSDKFVEIVLAIAEQMHLGREEMRNLRLAALLPDTGRFSIPEEILKKPGGLSKEEYNVIKRQHIESLKILEPLKFLKPVMPIIQYHHEHYDGRGYPKGLKGDEIPIGARIMAVADAFEAMITSRPYKEKNISISQAVKEIENNKNTQFDPEVVDAFKEVLKRPEFRKLFEFDEQSIRE